MKFTVKEFYRWSQYELSTAHGIVIDNWIDHGSMKIDPSIEKHVPHTFQMINGWKVREKDLKCLKGSPLLSNSGERLLVKSSLYIRSEKVVKILGSSLGAAWALIKIIEWAATKGWF